MICPNYKNKQVFHEFNEIVTALGGRAMTEDEFKDSTLRNLRTGLDLSAMEAAYRIWNRNNGEAIDNAPNGKPSLLFKTLLHLAGNNRTKAIKLKSLIYSNKFIDWFNGSKVVDANGEPLVVYTGTDANLHNGLVNATKTSGSGAAETRKRDDMYFNVQGYASLQYISGINRDNSDVDGFHNWVKLWWELKEIMSNGRRENNAWKDIVIGDDVRQEIPNKRGKFTRNEGGENGTYLRERKARYSYENKTDKEFFEDIFGIKFGEETFNQWVERNRLIFKNIFDNNSTIEGLYPAFVSLKNPITEEGQNTYYEEERGLMTQAEENGNDGIIGLNTDNEFGSDVVIAFDVNSSNNVMFLEPQLASLHNNEASLIELSDNISDVVDLQMDFGLDVATKLTNGETVSSRDIIEHSFMSSRLFTNRNKNLAQVLSKHDIPVRMTGTLPIGIVATTITDENGGSVVLINSNWYNQISSRSFGETVLHEIVHAVTSNALSNPQTQEQSKFKFNTERIFKALKNAISSEKYHLLDVSRGLYALQNEHEFVSVFLTSDIGRLTLLNLAHDVDVQQNGKFMNKIKKFINSVVNLFVNRNVFDSQEANLKQYEKYLRDYLTNTQAIQKGNISNKSYLKAVYNAIDQRVINNEVINQRMLDLAHFKENWKQNNVDLSYSINLLGKKKEDVSASDRYTFILNSLLSRIQALRSSRLPENVKQDLLNLAQALLNTLNNPNISKYESIQYLVRTMAPHILNSMDDLWNIHSIEDLTLENSNYIYQAHDNIGMFNTILENLSELLNNQKEILSIIGNHNSTNPEKIDSNQLNELLNEVKELSGVLAESKGMLSNILNRAALNSLYDTSLEVGSLEGMLMIQNIDSEDPVIEDDISWFLLTFGQADASDNEIVRAITYMINKANGKVEDRVLDRGLQLLAAQHALKSGESVVDLMEFVDGLTTQYLVRDLNFGAFERDYRNFMSTLNDDFNLPKNNMLAPENEIDRVRWNNRRNEWLLDRCERKYNERYYKAWAKVPTKVKVALDGINGAINSILVQYNVVDKDGIKHYERITNEEDWNQLQRLWVSKKLLRSPYDEFGNEKTGEAKEIADALNKLYEELYGKDYKERNKSIKKWRQARNAVIELCGGQLAYEKYLRLLKAGLDTSTSGFDYDRFDKWEERNSLKVFKRDAAGNAIVFDLIEQAIFALKIDYGKEYNELKEKSKELLRPYYDLAGEVNDDFLPESIKNLLNNVIYKRMKQIREEKLRTSPGLASISKRYGEVFLSYIKFVDTRYYKRIQKRVANEIFDAYDDFDLDMYEYAMAEYGNAYVFDDYIQVTPYKWLLKTEAIDDLYMEIVPNSAWLEETEDDSLMNPDFKDSYGTTMVPKRRYYDNSVAYNKVRNSQSLSKLYDLVLKTMKESNEMQTNRNWSNDYRLPGISASLFEKLKRAPWTRKWQVFSQWVMEKFGISKHSDQDILLREGTTANDTADSEGNEQRSMFTRILGTHPDGMSYKGIPQYYTRKLDNPENMTRELIDMVLSYYKMSVNYDEKLKIRDTCEGMLDFVKNRSYANKSAVSKKFDKFIHITGKGSSEESNVYKLLRNVLDIGLYNSVRKEFNFGPFQASAVFNTVRQYTSAINLGWNKKVAAVGFLTAMHAHVLNGIVGKEYKVKQLVFAMKEVAKLLPQRIFSGAESKSKVQVALVEFGIASQLDEMFKDTTRNRATRLLLHHNTFGYLATIDYLTKAQIAVACLDNYRWIDGKIYSSLDIDYLKHDTLRYKDLITKWSKSKSIYDLMNTKNGMISFDDLALLLEWNKNKHRIKMKCLKQAEKADGVASGLQRAAIQQTWFGMLMMIHRQFLPLMLHERLGKRVYDYDTQEYTHSQFRTLWEFLKELTYNSSVAGIGGMASAGLAFGGPWGAAIGTAIGSYMRYKGRKAGKNKSIKGVFDSFFRNTSTQQDSINSVENMYAVKLIAVENLMFALFNTFLVMPICALADDDKDDFFLQTLAYWLKAWYFEITGPYNVKDLISNIKSPTASTSLLDKITAMSNTTVSDLPQDLLYYLSLTDEPAKKVGNSSVYGGMAKWLKALIQLTTPLHNEFEQGTPFINPNAKGPKQKRNYLERQIMQEPTGSNKNVYKTIGNMFKNEQPIQLDNIQMPESPAMPNIDFSGF